MWTAILMQLGISIFKALPIERIVAMLVNKMLSKVDSGGDYQKAVNTCTHLEEISEKLRIILDDAVVKDDELEILRSVYTKDIAAIIALWAKGESAKALEQKVANAEASKA